MRHYQKPYAVVSPLLIVVFLLLLIGAVSACGSDAGSDGSDNQVSRGSKVALASAVDAANRRYGPDWDCAPVSAKPAIVVSCTQPSSDFGAVNEFRIVDGRALYWNGLRTAPASRFVPYVKEDFRREYRPAGKVRCTVVKASLPYTINCKAGVNGLDVSVSVDLLGQFDGTDGFGLGLP